MLISEGRNCSYNEAKACVIPIDWKIGKCWIVFIAWLFTALEASELCRQAR